MTVEELRKYICIDTDWIRGSEFRLFEQQHSNWEAYIIEAESIQAIWRHKAKPVVIFTDVKTGGEDDITIVQILGSAADLEEFLEFYTTTWS